MSFFSKGDFSIKESWEDKPKDKPKDQPKPPSREKKESLLANAAKNHMNVFQNPPSHEILDDVLSRRILGQFQSEKNMDPIVASKSTQKPKTKLPPKGKNEDIVTSMAGRLSKLELTCSSQRAELKEKGAEIDRLKEQNELLRKNQADPNAVVKQVDDIKKENQALKSKVEEMEKFLKSYGLKWVGNKIEGKMDKDKLKKDLEKPKYNYRLPSEIDIRTVAVRIEQLNMGMHGDGSSSTEVYKDKDGIHKIRKAEPLPIGFFADGIAIAGYPFFPYKSKDSLQILADILDGYFPYILKTKFPNGTFLKVVDKTQTKYADSLQGDRIGGLQQAADKQLRPMSKQQFLEKLPKQIIQNGKVIQIRGEIEKRFDGVKKNGEGEGYEEDADGMVVFRTEVQGKIEEGAMKEEEVCTLKVRTESGRVCILRLSPTAKMREVYGWMKKVADKKDFVVVGNYPKRQYDEAEPQTLDELGLAPNSALHLQSSQYQQ